MARTGKWPARIALAVSAAMIATLFTVINASGQGGGAGEALPTIGIEVQSATNAQVTYALVVRNQGSAPSTSVTVRSNVPTNTTFESSNPPPSATTSPSPGTASCDNAGTREDQDRTCQWNLGTIPAGETRQITAIYNLNQGNVTSYNVSITATVSDAEQHTNSDTDMSLNRDRQNIDHDTWVNDDEPPNWNHGNCPNLRVHQNNRVTTFLQANTLPTETNIEKVWGALLMAQVQTTSYTQAAPGSIGAHRITSGEWTEGASDSATNQNCPGAASTTTTDARTGAEPQSAAGATATAVINAFPQFAFWNVTTDLDDQTERAAANNNGWELKDVIGSGDNFTRFHSSEAANADQQPRLFVVYTTQEAASCVDADPETDTNPFGTEHIMTAFVTDGAKISNAGGDACNGGPAIDQVIWDIEDDTPDAYFSSAEGQPITKVIQQSNATPNEITTTAEDGTTFVGIRQNAPEPGDNRVEARIVDSSQDPADVEDTSDPDPNGQNRPACNLTPPLRPAGTDCDGETPEHDDVVKTWNASGASSGTGTGTGTTSTSPSTTSSTTGSPSASGSTGSPSQSTSTGSPTATSSTSRPPSGTTSGTSSSPAQSQRQVTLFTSANEVVYPGTITLSGQIVSNDNTCDDSGEFVRLQRRVFGESTFENLRSTNTDSQGGFQFEIPAEQSAEYIAFAPEHDNCTDATSTGETVLVKVKVTGRANRRTVERGSNVTISGRVQPDHAGTEVVLQRRRGGRWVKVRVDELDTGSRYRFVLKAGWQGRRTFRVQWKSQDSEHESNNSRNIVIRTQRPS